MNGSSEWPWSLVGIFLGIILAGRLIHGGVLLQSLLFESLSLSFLYPILKCFSEMFP